MPRNQTTGRYLVGDKAIPSLGAAIAFAGFAAINLAEPGTIYVREIGNPQALAYAVRDQDGVVHVTARKES